MAPIGAKLWENAFQTICNISFFDVGKNFCDLFRQKLLRKINYYSIGVLEELRWFELPGQVRRQKSLPEVGLFSLYDPC